MLNNLNLVEETTTFNLDDYPALSVDEVLGSGSWEILNSEKEILKHLFDDVLIPNSKVSTQREALNYC